VVTRGGWKKENDPSEVERHSVYVFVRRNTRFPMFEVFDMPDTHWSRAMASRVMNNSGLTSEAENRRGWRLAYSRLPSAQERSSALQFVERQIGLREEPSRAGGGGAIGLASIIRDGELIKELLA